MLTHIGNMPKSNSSSGAESECIRRCVCVFVFVSLDEKKKRRKEITQMLTYVRLLWPPILTRSVFVKMYLIGFN